MDNTLSIQDVLWRPLHGHIWLNCQEQEHPDIGILHQGLLDDMLADLKSVCADVEKAEAIGIHTGFTLYKKNCIPADKLLNIKESYKYVAEFLVKYEAHEVEPCETKVVQHTLRSLMEYYKTFRDRCS